MTLPLKVPLVCVLALTTASACLGQDEALRVSAGIPRFVLVPETPLMAERASTGGISWIDFDGDGDDDAFVTNGYDVSRTPAVPQPNRLYENVGGVLRPVRNQLSEGVGFSSGSAWADFDNDGLIDAFVPNQRGQDNFLYRNEGAGVFRELTEWGPSRDGGLSFSATWGDVDGDGFVDLFVGNGGLSGAESDRFYRNRAGAGFVAETGTPLTDDETRSGGATFLDYDLDGDLDLFVPGQPSRMFRNDGNGRLEPDQSPLFVNEPANDLSVSGAWADFDNDGDYDLFQVFAGGDPRRLYVNEGDGTFVRRELGDATAEASDAFHSLWVDLDNDGWLDLVVANWGAPPHVYWNRGGESLDRIMPGEIGERAWYASMVAASDYDLDGDIDLVVGNWPNEPGEAEANLLYRNEGPVGNWFALRLEGTRSNRSAIGARVEVTVRDGTDTRTLMRDVRSQDNWRSQSSLELIFGLGPADSADGVRVIWPSGIVQELGSVRAGMRRRVTEPADGDMDRTVDQGAAVQPAGVEALYAAVEQTMRKWQVPGVAVSVRWGDSAWARGFGIGDVEGSAPVTEDTRFAIGSTSKQFTAAAIMSLVEEGRLALEDPLAEVFPELPTSYHPITVRQLLIHESGVQRDFKAGHSLQGPELLDALAEAPLDFEPGTGWNYSNTGFVLLGMIVERVTGQSLHEFLEARVFEPLGMDSTVYRVPESGPIDRAVGYEGGTGQLTPLRFLPSRFGAGSIVSTARDMATWERAFTGDRVVSRASRMRMWLDLTPDPASSLQDGAGRPFTTGLGWWVVEDGDRIMVAHGGSVDGYLSTLDYYPSEDLAVVVMLNNEGSAGALNEIVRLIRDFYLAPP